MNSQWSDQWAYTMTGTQTQARGVGFDDVGEFIGVDIPELFTEDIVNGVTNVINDPSLETVLGVLPGVPNVYETAIDGIDLATDLPDWVGTDGNQNEGAPTAFTGGGVLGGFGVGEDPVPSNQPPPPVATSGSCPVGYMSNPNFNRNQAMAGGMTRSTEVPCIPNPNANATPDGVPSAGGVAASSGLDKNCEEKPNEFPAPAGCMPAVGAEGSFFSAQRTGCRQEWKNLERMEDEVKARYEQLCVAREKFNQRKERYGDMCGPYELLYGIEEAKEKEAAAKEKAKKECLANKNPSGGKGGCGCVHKAPSGCGCGCSGKETKKTGMEYEYADPVKSACKRAVDESFKSNKRAKVATSSCMPCESMKKTAVKKKKTPTRKLRKPKKTKTTQKAVVTKNYKRQCVAG